MRSLTLNSEHSLWNSLRRTSAIRIKSLKSKILNKKNLSKVKIFSTLISNVILFKNKIILGEEKKHTFFCKIKFADLNSGFPLKSPQMLKIKNHQHSASEMH